jgi:hypothetical protein
VENDVGLVAILSMLVISDGGCQLPPDTEMELVREYGIDEEIVKHARESGGSIRKLEPKREGWTPSEIRGVLLEIPKSRVDNFLDRCRPLLKAKDWHLIRVGPAYTGAREKQYALLQGGDPLRLLGVLETNGMNYGVSNAALIETLNRWHDKFSIELQGADFDWIELKFSRLPEDLSELSAEIAKLCPDVASGKSLSQSLLADFRQSRTISLWWD